MAKSKLRKKFDVLYAELEFEIAAPKERVWKALVEQVGNWWPREFAAGKKAQRIVLEPRLGGRLYEDWGDGAGLTWYTVETFDPPDLIEWKGRMSKNFGGPAMQLIELRLEPVGKGTTLRLSDTVFGAIDPELLAKDLSEGWTLIFETKFKPFVEKMN